MGIRVNLRPLHKYKKQDTQDRKRQDEQDGFIYPANHVGASPIIFILSLYLCNGLNLYQQSPFC